MLLALLAFGCHSGPSSGVSASYDSASVTPGGNTRQDDSLQAQLRAPDSVFEDGSRPTSWRAAGFSDPLAFKLFLIDFKTWVRRDQVDSIAHHIRFPIRGAGSVAWFKERYPRVFTPRIKNVVARQRLDRIFRNGQGAMMGNGEVWFVEERGKYWVSAVN